MGSLLEHLKRIVGKGQRGPGGQGRRGRRRDSEYTGVTNIKEIRDAPPERAAELAGHAPERRD